MSKFKDWERPEFNYKKWNDLQTAEIFRIAESVYGQHVNSLLIFARLGEPTAPIHHVHAAFLGDVNPKIMENYADSFQHLFEQIMKDEENQPDKWK